MNNNSCLEDLVLSEADGSEAKSRLLVCEKFLANEISSMTNAWGRLNKENRSEVLIP